MPRKKSLKKIKEEKKVATRKKKSETKKNFSRLRGVKDVWTDDYKYWNLIIKKSEELARIYGFLKVKPPVMEDAGLFEASMVDSDIVSKELYSFTDKESDFKLALRPEATSGMARAYWDKKGADNLEPVKLSFFGPVFRSVFPKSGKFKQFHQFSLEVFGESEPVADFMLILATFNFFKELQIDTQVQINNLGCEDCQEKYTEEVENFYKERGKKTKLCAECKKTANKDILTLLECAEDGCVENKEDIPQIVDYLCDSCKNDFIKILEYLDEIEINYNLNPFLLSGRQYRNGTIFEFWPLDENGEIGKDKMALAGGGRHDRLIERVGGDPTPACGVSIGAERTILKIKEKNIPIKQEEENLVFIAQLGDQAKRKTIKLFEELRKIGFSVRQSFIKNDLKSQLKEAEAMNAKITLILGQKELMEETILIRDMESGNQEVIDYKKIKTELEKRLKK